MKIIYETNGSYEKNEKSTWKKFSILKNERVKYKMNKKNFIPRCNSKKFSLVREDKVNNPPKKRRQEKRRCLGTSILKRDNSLYFSLSMLCVFILRFLNDFFKRPFPKQPKVPTDKSWKYARTSGARFAN